MYIAIEGVKGVGKTTVINHLPQMLRDLWSDNHIEVLSPTRPMTAPHPLELQYKHHRDNDDLREQLCSSFKLSRQSYQLAGRYDYWR